MQGTYLFTLCALSVFAALSAFLVFAKKRIQGRIGRYIATQFQSGSTPPAMPTVRSESEGLDGMLPASPEESSFEMSIRGNALRIIEEEAGLPFAKLKEVRRQTNAAYREAVQAISQGDASALKDGKRTTKLAQGIAALNSMGAIVEMSGEERYRQMAHDYLEAVSERKNDGSAKSALVVAPTQAEGDQITAYIRAELKEQGRLSAPECEFTALESANWTAAQRKDASLYQSGLVVQFHQNTKGFKRGEKVEVLGHEKDVVSVKRDSGERATLVLADAERFQVYRQTALELAAGDLVRITQNGYTAETTRTGKSAKARLNNGAVYSVAGFTEEGDIRLTNGFVVPKNYGHLNYGYTSTSHASQGKTVDKIFVAMGQDSFAAVIRTKVLMFHRLECPVKEIARHLKVPTAEVQLMVQFSELQGSHSIQG